MPGSAALRSSAAAGGAAEAAELSRDGGARAGGSLLCGRSPDDVARALFTLGKFGRVGDIVTVMDAQLRAGVLDAKCAYLGLKALALHRRGAREVPELMRRMQEQGGGVQGQGGRGQPYGSSGAGSAGAGMGNSGTGGGGTASGGAVALSRKDWQYILNRAAFARDVDGVEAGPTKWGQPSTTATGWPDKPAYDLLVRAAGDAGDVARAESLVREMMERTVTDDGSTWASNYAYGGRPASAGTSAAHAGSGNSGGAHRSTSRGGTASIVTGGTRDEAVASSPGGINPNVGGPAAPCAGVGGRARLRCPPNEATFSVLASMYARRGMADAAYGVVERARRYGCKLDASLFNPVVAVLDLARAHALVEQMVRDGATPTVVTYTALMQVHQREMARDPGTAADASLALLDRMAAAGVAADSSAWNVSVRACCAAGRVDDALALVGRMVGRGVMPDAVTLTPLLEAYADQGDREGVKRVYDAAVRGRGSFWPPGWGKVPAGGRVGAGKEGGGDDRQVGKQDRNRDPQSQERKQGGNQDDIQERSQGGDQVPAGSDHIPRVTPDAVLYNATVRALLRVGDVDAAWDVFQDMRSQGGGGGAPQ
eukprot:jgi/Mesvir1/25492/Mv01750-RA.1